MYAWNFLCRNRLKILLLSVCGSVSCGKKVSWNRPLIVVAAVAVVVVVVVTDFNVPLLLLGFFRCTRKWWDLKRTTFQTDRQERESHFWFKNGPKSCCCQNQVFQSFSIFSFTSDLLVSTPDPTYVTINQDDGLSGRVDWRSHSVRK